MTLSPATVDRIVDVLRVLSEQVSRAAVAGPLTYEQSERLQVALGIVSGLEESFRATQQQAGDVTPMTRES